MSETPTQTKFPAKEKFEGTWAPRNEHVSFNRVWGANDHWKGHRFTDAQCQKLLAGEVISFDATSKKNTSYTAVGDLAEGEINDHKFVGFKLDFDKVDPTASPVPKSMAGHTFTAEERTALEAGEKVFVDGLTSKKGNTFGATLYVGIRDGETKESIIFDFNSK